MIFAHLFLLFGCGSQNKQPDSASDSACGEPQNTQVAVITSLSFAYRDGNNQTVGFNLDEHITEQGDSKGCGIGDVTGLDGTEGVDSVFSGMLPALDATQFVAVHGLIQDSIRSGELLLMLELSKIDDASNDECVDFGLWRGEGTPFIGTDGEVLDAQSFARSDITEPALINQTTLQDGTMGVSNLTYTLELQVLDEYVSFNLQQGSLRADWTPAGNVSGYFGGAVSLDDFTPLTSLNDIGSVGTLLEGLLANAADMDLDGDGTCDAITVMFEFEGVQAFFYEE